MSAAMALAHDLEREIHSRTDRRVRNLAVEFRADRVIVRGQASSYYVKQLALQGLLGVLPKYWRIKNEISVAAKR